MAMVAGKMGSGLGLEPSLPLRLECVLVLHSPQERGPQMPPRRLLGWRLEAGGRAAPLRKSAIRSVKPGARYSLPNLGVSHAGRLLIGYGSRVRPHAGTDQFGIYPDQRVRRLAGLFDPAERVTDPLAFLRCLHKKGSYRAGRARALLRRLTADLSRWLGWDVADALDRPLELERQWKRTSAALRRPAVVLLDIARHMYDASDRLRDDNLLAHPDAIGLLEEMVRRRLEVNFNQTLDLTRLTPEAADLLRRIPSANAEFKRRVYYFSLNNARRLDLMRRRYALLGMSPSDNVEFICMYGFDTTLAEDVERFRFLRSLPGAYVFVQRYRPIPGGPQPDLDRFFDDRAEALIDELVRILFGQNMKSMEKYYRWLAIEYATQCRRIHRGLIETLFRYNRRSCMAGFLHQLTTLCSDRSIVHVHE